MGEIKCFMVADTGRDRLSLRRFVFHANGGSCSGRMGYHDASVPIGEAAEDGTIVTTTKPSSGYENDWRWPKSCECGYAFKADDQWQVSCKSIYRRDDTGEEFTQEELPAGAMYDATWLKGEGSEKRVGPDGLALHVVCPPGKSWGDHWHVDGPANNGPGWQRSGTVPNVTANPSILTPRYHGWLRNGILVSC
jgi:hypothetical protein